MPEVRKVSVQYTENLTYPGLIKRNLWDKGKLNLNLLNL